MWDQAAAERYEAWYATPRGSFALAREQRLMADMVSPWQRRNHSLLEIGCGAGHFLEMFHDGGFDVTGVDKSEAMLDKARERMGSRATLRVADAARLPFDDDEFDYVAIVTALECMDDPGSALSEAFRVARRGVVIAYLNSWSVYRQEQRFARFRRQLRYSLAVRKAEKAGLPPPDPGRRRALDSPWFNLVSICRLIRDVSGHRPSSFRSTLFSPSFCWRGIKPFSLSWAHLLPFGAVSVVRVDLMPVAATATVIRTPKMAPAARAPAGVITMDSSGKTM
ncbi:MAG: class I SAM-dependent methyltransferase [Deltaproteobacteria bacterium]|nr:class I SAM-dependent methyltransferase [Deltaproteobacteria bacterium]